MYMHRVCVYGCEICMGASQHVCMYAHCVCVRVRVCMYARQYVCMETYAYIHHVCVYGRKSISMRVCMRTMRA